MSVMGADTIRFPNLGLTLPHVGRGIAIGSFEIHFYGVLIAAAMLAGIYLAMWLAKKTGQDPEAYFSFAVGAVILSVLGARLYYVIFSWDYYGSHPLEIFDLRGGGLAIYGGVITGVVSAVLYCRWKRLGLLCFLDTAVPALALGQAIGRWGNFFNREAFGGYSDGLLAMQLPQEAVRSGEITQEMLAHTVVLDGIRFIQVHPTFLYESIWVLMLTASMVLWILKGKKRRDGDIFMLYLGGYGLGRAWIEGLRTDQLHLPGTRLAVSQLLSLLLVLAAAAWFIVRVLRKRDARGKTV